MVPYHTGRQKYLRYGFVFFVVHGRMYVLGEKVDVFSFEKKRLR